MYRCSSIEYYSLKEYAYYSSPYLAFCSLCFMKMYGHSFSNSTDKYQAGIVLCPRALLLEKTSAEILDLSVLLK